MNQATVHNVAEESLNLNDFIRACRLRIAPGSRTIGSFIRHSSRVDKPVSQEEAAEAVGVTRQWFALMESRPSIRISTSVLSRLCEAFVLDDGERERLFALALPEIASVRTPGRRRDAHDAFTWMRTSANRLWSANGEYDVLRVATQQLAEHFSEAPLVSATLRSGPGKWENVCYIAEERIAERFRSLWAWVTTAASPEHADKMRLYPELLHPGEVRAVTSHFNVVGGSLGQILALSEFSTWNLLYGRVHSKSGLIAGLMVKQPNRDYSEEDRLAMSTLADLASLALS